MIIGSEQYRKVVEICHDWTLDALVGRVNNTPSREALEILNNTLDTTFNSTMMRRYIDLLFNKGQAFERREDDHLRMATAFIDIAGRSIFCDLDSGDDVMLQRMAITLKQVFGLGPSATSEAIARELEIVTISIELELDDRYYEQEQEDAASIDPERVRQDDEGDENKD